MAGSFDDAAKYLQAFTRMEDGPASMEAYWAIFKQKYLEALDRLAWFATQRVSFAGECTKPDSMCFLQLDWTQEGLRRGSEGSQEGSGSVSEHQQGNVPGAHIPPDLGRLQVCPAFGSPR